MKKPAEYRRNAEACRKLADGTLAGEDRARLLDMAQHWVNLAEAREALLAKHPELDRSGVFAQAQEQAQERGQGQSEAKSARGGEATN